MISVSNLSKQFGDRTLFEGASFQLNSGQRYGLVGANGCGKTTLLNVMSGHMESTEGSVSIPKRLRLGVLRQDQFLYEEQEVLNVALMGNPDLWDAMAEKEKILAAAEGGEAEFDADRFGELEEIVQLYDGYTAEARAATILEGLGLPAEVHRRPLSTLSGGFRLRVLLAQVLASAPDVLLLDEPTNHLDILSIRWLEKFLREFAGPVVVISHDHRFLDQVVTDILDVDYQTVMLYKGNYSFFINAKQEDRDRREKEISSREKEIAHHQKFVDRFKAKASKARQAGSKLKLIEKKSADLTALPGSSRRYPKFRFEPRRPSGKEVLTISGITKAFGENQVLHGVDLEVRRGDRLAIMGPNGIGKSTLLKIVMDDLEADEGEVKWGYETHRGYFAQDHKEDFDDASRTAEEWLWDFCASRDRGYVRGQMGMMLFSGDEGEKRLEALSGGEAARLIFSRLAIERPNVLILDEPTNHLDLESIEALVHGLKNFDGTLILVSHDRWFVSQLATRVVEIKPDEVRDYLGTYEEYVHFCGDDHLDSDSVVMKAKAERKDSKKSGKDSWKENKKARSVAPEVLLNRLTRQRDDLTRKIETAEARISEIDQAFCEPGFFEDTSADEVADLDNERAKLKGKVEDVMSQWEGVEREIERVPNS
ncbi:MAG: ABC-F family ATP-binding cassette domain-containing protein [Gemmatimonadales bacterium]|jgi:ATPase subunit of ABC transporter with duplicated ATPase domains|nr:ABC-F family ATP-binding cassette domain-containing protein [Gemmatimonadales bacterium]MDG2239984.1 ABC-F family ATP-binding cassette domain-containing protein [Longimicrobiales bacterium]NCG33539.1 ATP-binding cassette domain-containing protein [Pseudomonadota bacterium]MBT3499621.1 ABC-F family ATP-binding cassette domain-containing protein [Gemmatimonadales bacterium]MBT3776028.1 ABC-F family ATP-binding cassette domain-containing protein [Gemmatimonadales bacterium]